MELNPIYKPLFKWNTGKKYIWLTGGRGSAKSFHTSVFAVNALHEKNVVELYTRFTMRSAQKSIIPEVANKIPHMANPEHFHVTNDSIVHEGTGSYIMFSGIKTSSGDQTANLKSLPNVNIWILDEAEEERNEDRFFDISRSVRSNQAPNKIISIMNPCDKQHFMFKRWLGQTSKYITVEGVDIPISDHPQVEHIHTTYLDNLKHLPKDYLEEIELDKQNPHRYRHVWLGEWLEDAEGLLWNQAIIDRSRISQNEIPDFARIVVAIDPAVTANDKSDETGIIVCAKDGQGIGYVLEDLSGVYSPEQWGTVASKAAIRWDADTFVAEKNQGGDMVESVLRQFDKRNRVKLVTATKGKYLRAEPVYALYQRKKVCHVGEHPMLERQMITFNPNANDKSPDRVDALVWGLTDLLVNPKKDLVFI